MYLCYMPLYKLSYQVTMVTCTAASIFKNFSTAGKNKSEVFLYLTCLTYSSHFSDLACTGASLAAASLLAASSPEG